jgi:peptidoglycan/LPS O-acetylase OafA/YrhL
MAVESRIQTIGFLRGVAVLAVCCCHFSRAVLNGAFLNQLFNWLHENGKHGVEIFFVISGFVIPYSLYKAEYRLKHYFKFLYKRVLRLHPPYLAALFITLLIASPSYMERHVANPENWNSILLSVFYLHFPADNPVFWTLQIEMEYYLFVGLFFVLLIKAPKIAILVGFPVLLILSRTPGAEYFGLLKYICFFLIGMTGYLIYIKDKNRTLEYIALAALVTFSFVYGPLNGAIASLVTILIILFYRRPFSAAFEFPGEISYSLYLLHFVIGIKLINVLRPKVEPAHYWMLFIAAFIVCLLVSWVFWKFIEKPSARLSNRVKLGAKKIEFSNYNLKTAGN